MLCSTRGGGRKKRAADEADEEYIRLWMPMEPSHRDRQPRDTVVEISLIRETNRPMGSVQRGSAAKNPKERQFFQRQILAEVGVFSNIFGFVTANWCAVT